MLNELLSFTELDAKARYAPPPGRLHIRASRPVAVFALVQGVECLVGTGTDIKCYANDIEETWVEPVDGKAVRVFMYAPVGQTIEPTGEVFTNMDRQPLVSGHMAELAKEMRLFRLQQQEILKQSRAEMKAATRAARRQRSDEVEDNGGEDTPPAVDDAEPEPQGEGEAQT